MALNGAEPKQITILGLTISIWGSAYFLVLSTRAGNATPRLSQHLISQRLSGDKTSTLSGFGQWASKPCVRNSTGQMQRWLLVVQDHYLKNGLQFRDADPKSRLNTGIDAFISSGIASLFECCEWRVKNDKPGVRRLIFVAKPQKRYNKGGMQDGSDALSVRLPRLSVNLDVETLIIKLDLRLSFPRPFFQDNAEFMCGDGIDSFPLFRRGFGLYECCLQRFPHGNQGVCLLRVNLQGLQFQASLN